MTVSWSQRYGVRWRVSCGRCAAQLPKVRRPQGFREAMFGGWTCPQCGYKVDRVGRPLEEYPYPGPAWFLTQTARGAVGLLLGGLFELALATLTTYYALTRTSWWWLEAALFVLIGMPTAAGGAMSVYAHRRWPPARTDTPNPITPTPVSPV